MRTFISDISKKEFPVSDRIPGSTIRESLFTIIKKSNPDFTENHALAISELNHFREKYISEFLGKQLGEMTELEKTVLTALSDDSTISDKMDIDDNNAMTFSQKLADKVASFGGSWVFITSFFLFLLIWIVANGYFLTSRAFDPFPFILLNLILSCIAAIQAPIIMMSQNRQEEKDRDRAKKDYMINLKSELEIRILHEKIDHLIIHQQQELLEIQKVQIEMMNDIMLKIGESTK